MVDGKKPRPILMCLCRNICVFGRDCELVTERAVENSACFLLKIAKCRERLLKIVNMRRGRLLE